MTTYTFDRHAEMSEETLSLIGDILRTYGLPSDIENMLYGLYDGYYYEELFKSFYNNCEKWNLMYDTKFSVVKSLDSLTLAMFKVQQVVKDYKLTELQQA